MEFEKLQAIIADVLNVPKDDITPETTFVDDLGADSLDIFQIIMGIEEEFDIEIDNEEAEKIVSVGDAVEAIKEVNGQMFICADHGNAEQLIDYETGAPWTAHTTNPVPFILVNADPKYTLRENGCLADIVPTLIQLMGMEQPAEMTGKSLLVEK